jgi:uncharacterized RDD family membrane protein YckC
VITVFVHTGLHPSSQLESQNKPLGNHNQRINLPENRFKKAFFMGIMLQTKQGQVGPFDKATVEGKLNRKEIELTDFYWQKGMNDWMQLSNLFPDLSSSQQGVHFESSVAQAKLGTLRLATPGKRFVAGLIDFAITIIPSLLLDMALPIVGGLVVAGCYTIFLMANPKYRGTFGMKAMSIAIVDELGNPISVSKATTRFFVSIGSTLVLLIGYLVMFFNEKHQTWHDSAASTFVVEA